MSKELANEINIYGKRIETLLDEIDALKAKLRIAKEVLELYGNKECWIIKERDSYGQPSPEFDPPGDLQPEWVFDEIDPGDEPFAIAQKALENMGA